MFQNLENKHFHSIDILRGIASLCVCYVHLADGIPDFLDINSPFHKIAHYGRLGVDVFFLISGFVIPLSLHKYNYKINYFFKFMGKRIIRIDPPYYVSIILVLLSMYLTSLHPMPRGVYSFDLTSILLHIGYLVDLFDKFWVNPVYWTLAIEFQFYILIALLFPLLDFKKFSGKLTLLCFFASYFLTIGFSKYFTETVTVFNYSLHFTLGVTLYMYVTNKIDKIMAILFSVIILGVISFQVGIINSFVLLIACYMILFTNYPTRIGKFFGNISYSLYLIHAIIGTKLLSISTLYVQNNDLRVVLIFLVFIFTIFCSYLYFKLIEIPFLRISRKIDLK